MKILYVAMDAAPYSDRSHEVKVAEEFTRQGHEVLLVAEREPKWSADSPRPEALKFLGAFPVNVPGKAAEVAGSLPDADVGFASSVSGAPLLAKWKKRHTRPAVAQVLDVPMWRLQAGIPAPRPWREEWRPWFEGLREMTQLIANTQVTKADLEACASGIYQGDPLPLIEVVYYGVDTEAADAAKPVRPEGGPRTWACCTGRLVPYRGVDLAIQGLALVPREVRPGLVVVGTGDEERLWHLAQLAGVSVAFAGACPDAYKWSIIKGCDVGLALQFNPNIPQQAGTEFLYAGKPCVVADLPIHRERTGEFVSYVNPFDTRAVAESIIEQVEARKGPVSYSYSPWVAEHRSFRSHARGVLDTLKRCT